MSNFREQFLKQEREKEYESYFERPDYTYSNLYGSQIDANTRMDNGRRHYAVPSGNFYPSVTTVIGATQSPEKKKILDNWVKRVGEAEAERIKNAAADRGSLMHDMCEQFLLPKGESTFEKPDEHTNAFALWKQVQPLLVKHINHIHNLEGVLYSDTMRIAGRVDCVAEWDGVLSVIDFKTTIKDKKESWITDYFIQETAYAIMYGEMYGKKVKQIVTVMAKDNGFLSDGVVYIKKPTDYVEPLIARIKQYHKENAK